MTIFRWLAMLMVVYIFLNITAAAIHNGCKGINTKKSFDIRGIFVGLMALGIGTFLMYQLVP